jgi:hypothetical protein
VMLNGKTKWLRGNDNEGLWRLFIYYHLLNKATIRNQYPLPIIDEYLIK